MKRSATNYFSYFATDPLKMTDAEWDHITKLIGQLREEMRQNEDSPALRGVILGYLRLVMEYYHTEKQIKV